MTEMKSETEMIKGRCKDCYYAEPKGQYRYECPFRSGLRLVRPECYCESFRDRKEAERK